jgi:hypothetical protein
MVAAGRTNYSSSTLLGGKLTAFIWAQGIVSGETLTMKFRDIYLDMVSSPQRVPVGVR